MSVDSWKYAQAKQRGIQLKSVDVASFLGDALQGVKYTASGQMLCHHCGSPHLHLDADDSTDNGDGSRSVDLTCEVCGMGNSLLIETHKGSTYVCWADERLD